MQYDYYCESCEEVWEERQFLNDRDLPTTLPCPHCKATGTVKRGFFKAAHFSYAGAKTNLQRAGSGWNDVLTSIKKASGRKSTIVTR
jgi:putative FmdB family regulatory protein